MSSLLFAIDQLTKYLVYDQSRNVNRVIFHPAFNSGVSRSVQIPLFVIIVIALLALVAFIVAYQKKYFNRIIFVVLLAGTMGNLVDRVFLQGVRDFLYIGSWFPVFNLADVYLNIGVWIFIILQLFP